MMTRLTLTALCCCFAATAFAADVYKWKDAQGRVHYGDQARQNAEKVNINPASTESAPEAGKTTQQAKKVEECGHQRDQLMTYQSAVRIVEKDALGNEKEYSEAERQKLIELKQKQIADQCADVPAETSKPKEAPNGAQ